MCVPPLWHLRALFKAQRLGLNPGIHFPQQEKSLTQACGTSQSRREGHISIVNLLAPPETFKSNTKGVLQGVFFLSQEAKRYTWRCKGQPRSCACASLMPAFPGDAEKRDCPLFVHPGRVLPPSQPAVPRGFYRNSGFNFGAF